MSATVLSEQTLKYLYQGGEENKMSILFALMPVLKGCQNESENQKRGKCQGKSLAVN